MDVRDSEIDLNKHPPDLSVSQMDADNFCYNLKGAFKCIKQCQLVTSPKME